MGLLRKIPVKARVPLMNWGLELFARAKLPLPSNQRPVRGPLIISSFLSETSGIGQGGRLTTQALARAGFNTVSHDIGTCYNHMRKGNAEFPTRFPGGVWLLHANAQECLIALLAFRRDDWQDRYRIGYWAWETSRASPFWAWAAQFFHEIWVPSRFVARALDEAFAIAGASYLSARVRVMPHPILDLENIRPDRPAFSLDPFAFEALCLLDARSTAMRKNPWASLDAWIQAFPKAAPGINLRVKIQNLNEDAVARRRLASILERRSDIRLIESRFETSVMMKFLASFDAIISLHRSEGFGLTLAEAMAMGVSVVATGWSGNMDFMDDNNSYLVPYKLIPVKDPSGMYGKPFGRVDPFQKWAEPDVSEAGKIIQSMVADTARLLKMEKARQTILELNKAWDGSALRQHEFASFLQ